MSIESKDNALMKMIKSLLKFLFKGGNSLTGGEVDKQEPSNLLFQCGEAGKVLSEMSKDAMGNDEVVKSYMYECQKVVTDKIQDLLKDGGDLSSLKPEQLKEIASDINEKLEDLSATDEVKDGFQDYHNHDKKLLSSLSKEVNTNFKTIFEELGSNSIEQLSALSEFATEHVVDHMTKLPESRAKQLGIEPESPSNDLNSSKDNDRSMDREVDYDDSPSPSMTP